MFVPMLKSFHEEQISWFGDSLRELQITVLASQELGRWKNEIDAKLRFWNDEATQ